MKASSSMTRKVTVVGPALPLTVAWQLMTDQRIRHLPVVQAGRLVGILSDRDLLLHATLDGGEIRVPRDPVAIAMTPAPITCSKETSVSRLVQIMVDQSIDSLPVVDDEGTLVGLVTSTDLLLLLCDYEEGAAMPFDFRVEEHGAVGAVA